MTASVFSRLIAVAAATLTVGLKIEVMEYSLSEASDGLWLNGYLRLTAHNLGLSTRTLHTFVYTLTPEQMNQGQGQRRSCIH